MHWYARQLSSKHQGYRCSCRGILPQAKSRHVPVTPTHFTATSAVSKASTSTTGWLRSCKFTFESTSHKNSSLSKVRSPMASRAHTLWTHPSVTRASRIWLVPRIRSTLKMPRSSNWLRWKYRSKTIPITGIMNRCIRLRLQIRSLVPIRSGFRFQHWLHKGPMVLRVIVNCPRRLKIISRSWR